jgi:hypothetical protein
MRGVNERCEGEVSHGGCEAWPADAVEPPRTTIRVQQSRGAVSTERKGHSRACDRVPEGCTCAEWMAAVESICAGPGRL